MHPPHMATLEEVQQYEQHEEAQANVTVAGREPVLVVQPGNDTNDKGGKSLIFPPKVFTGKRAKAEDFIQDFDLCWRLNRSHPSFKQPYNQIILALSYIRGNTAIQNWVKHKMHKIDVLTSIAHMNPVPYISKHLWTEFWSDFNMAFTNMTKV